MTSREVPALVSEAPDLAATAPSELVEAQRFIAQAVRQLRRVDRTAATTARAQELLTGNDRLTPAESLEIYRRQFWLRHTSSLLEDYPGLSGILGQRAWEQLIESYLASVPITSYTLRDLGTALADHVAARPETPHQALCVDMARLERLYTELFDAAEPVPLDAAKLAAIPEEAWPSARIVFSPCLRLLNVDYPVAQLRKRLRKAALSEHAPPVEIPGRQPHTLALYRDEARVLRYEALAKAPAAILHALQTGAELGAACEHAAEQHPGSQHHIETEVGAWFAHWGERRWIVDVVV